MSNMTARALTTSSSSSSVTADSRVCKKNSLTLGLRVSRTPFRYRVMSMSSRYLMSLDGSASREWMSGMLNQLA